MDLLFSVLAQAGKGRQAPVPGCGGAGLSQLVMLGIMFVVFYFLLIRPQQKKQKEHRDMLAALKRGDKVITNGGILGKITGITDHIVVLEVAEKIRMRVLRSHILGKQTDLGSSSGNGGASGGGDA